MVAMQEYIFSPILLFVVVYFAYGSSYLLRIPYGMVKDDIIIRYELSSDYLDYVDMAFFLPYSLVSLTMGDTVEFLGPHLTLSLGLITSALATCILPICDSFVVFLLFVAVSGASQSLCWPSSCALISNSFDNSESTVFGLFGSCCFLGRIVEKLLVLYFSDSYLWLAIFLVPSALVGMMGCLLLVNGIYFPAMRWKSSNMGSILLPYNIGKTVTKVTSWQVFMLPGVVEVSFTMFFVKLIWCIFMFWFPCINKNWNKTQLDPFYGSLSFDFGGMLGSCLIGIFSDKFAKGMDMCVCLLSITFCSINLIAFYFLPNAGWVIHVLPLIISGSLNFGSDVLLCGSVSVKIAKQYGSSTSVLTSLTGIVNGIGSLAMVVGGPIVDFFSSWFEWHTMLLVYIGFYAAVCVSTSRVKTRVGKKSNF